MGLRRRVENRLRMRTLALLGPQLGRQHGVAGWLASPALNRLHRGIIAQSVAALQLRPGETVADVGFGGGVGLRMLLDAVGSSGRVHGIELSGMSVRRARFVYRSALRQGHLFIDEAPVERMPVAPRTLDAAMTVNTIHHFADLGVAFGSLASALRPGGRLVLAFPDPERQASLELTSRHGHRPRPLSEVEERLGEAGLVPEPIPGGGGVYQLLRAIRSD